MAYEPYNWENGEAGGTPITAERLNHIERGIAEIELTPGPQGEEGPQGIQGIQGPRQGTMYGRGKEHPMLMAHTQIGNHLSESQEIKGRREIRVTKALKVWLALTGSPPKHSGTTSLLASLR